MKDRVVICDSCAAEGASPLGSAWANKLSAAAAESGLDIDVKMTSCLNMCDTPLSFALQGAEKATYLFSGVNPKTDTKDMIGLLRLYLDAPDGWITKAADAGRLRFCMKGRVPKL